MVVWNPGAQAGAFFNCLQCGKRMRRNRGGKLREPFCCAKHKEFYAEQLKIKHALEACDNAERIAKKGSRTKR